MKMMNRFKTLIVLLLMVSCMDSNGQNNISLSNRSPIYLDLTPNFSAGSPKKIIIDESQWLNYTTLVQDSDPNLSINIELASGSLPEGIKLFVEAKAYAGMSKGKPGQAGPKIEVSHRPQPLIKNIGTCYTGSGINEGHQLRFSFVITDYGKIHSGSSTIYVQYTISQ